jgi:AAA+ superfamily predicted ATPase
MPDISKEYFWDLTELADTFVEFIKKLKNDPGFSAFIAGRDIGDPDQAIIGGLSLDVLKWFNMVSDLSDLESKEAFSLLLLIGKLYGSGIFDNYDNLPAVYQPQILSIYENLRAKLKPKINKEPTSYMADFLGAYSPEMKREYLTCLYRFASIVVKADGTVSDEEAAALKTIMVISDQQTPAQVASGGASQPDTKSEVKPAPAPKKEKTLDEVVAELNSMIGLTEVKKEINTLINYIKVQKARASEGLKTSPLSYHTVFTGNPGTGKTTVARLLAGIYKNLGLLTGGQLVETDRSGLVAEYVGQTAIKTNKTVDSALNGILFIDEAYALGGETPDQFGKEAVSTLIKRMEDDRAKLAVVLAGYIDEMKGFLDSNPGIKSRFNRYIEFADYSPAELLDIFKLQCKNLEYTLTADAEKKVIDIIATAYAARDKSFGNGRYVRNIFEKTIEQQSNRIAAIAPLTKEILATITPDDIRVK